jgi:hypothetical protein
MTSHSANIQITLLVADRELRIGHLGPNYVILDDPVDAPLSDAQLSLSVDGTTTRWPIQLPEGISTTRLRTHIERQKPHSAG